MAVCPTTLSQPPAAVPKRASVFILVAVFLALSLLKAVTHEMWRDEIATWALARESGTLWELFHNSRYGGHPCLWSILVYLLNRLTDDPFAIQVLNVLLATIAVWVMARSAPWSPWQKAALASGYYLFFEYNTIARPYSLGLLFTFVACTLLCAPRPRWGLLAATLFLLAQTTVYGVILACAISASALIIFVNELRDGQVSRRELIGFAASSLAVLLGLFLSAASMLPPPDIGFAVGWRTEIDPWVMGRSLTRLWRAFVPIPQFQLQFWNTNILEDHRPLQAFLGLLLLIGAGLFLRRNRPAFALWFTGTCGLLLFTYLKYDGYQRHHGNLFVVFLAAWWIRDGRRDAPPSSHGSRFDRTAWLPVAVILCSQSVAGIYASVMDVVHPFSMSGEVARYIAEHGRDAIVVADADHAGVAVAARLKRPLYYVTSGELRIRIEYNERRRKRVSAAEIYAAAANLQAADRRDVLLLLNHPMPSRPGFRLLRTFDGAICVSEEYDLFEFVTPDTGP